jgi:glycosyltransferase involved in cell wall biosynthesis
MRIAILGIRGVPANYGGFETFAEQLGWRLVERGHEVTVYGRDHYIARDVQWYRGIRIVRLPAPRSKYFETVVHSLFAAAHASVRGFDVIYICNSANVPAAVLLRLLGRRVVLNVDGLEWQRAKWNRIGKAYYRACAWLASHLPIHVVTDAAVIQRHYLESYGRATELFPYGTDAEVALDDGTLDRLGLTSRQYILYVSRLEPENNAHIVIHAFRKVHTDFPLVIVGDAPYATEYIDDLHRAADPRVRFVGAIYGNGYRVLQSHASVYVQATEVGGTHPALVEAMGFGSAILANDVAEHRETLGEAGRYYAGPVDLAAKLSDLLGDEGQLERYRQAARERAISRFSWDAVAHRYESWFAQIAEVA